MSIITLTTDYGLRDPYLGELKGVILSLAPKVQVVDVTHEIEPFQVMHGAFVLLQVLRWYPRGTIHVAVVDPGVGSSRQIVIGQYSGHYIVAPNNGLLTFVHRELPVENLRIVEERKYWLPVVSASFHGRDIMAPVAAHLANGIPLNEFGRVADRLEMLPVGHRADTDGTILRGTVIYVDRFGTLVTNIHEDQLAASRSRSTVSQVFVNGVGIGPIQNTFSDVRPDEAVAIVGSNGFLEVAINQGRAVDQFGGASAVAVEVR